MTKYFRAHSQITGELIYIPFAAELIRYNGGAIAFYRKESFLLVESPKTIGWIILRKTYYGK